MPRHDNKEKYQLLIEFTQFRAEQNNEAIRRLEPLVKKITKMENGVNEWEGEAFRLKSLLKIFQSSVTSLENDIRKYQDELED